MIGYYRSEPLYEVIGAEDNIGITKDTYNYKRVHCQKIKYHPSPAKESMSEKPVWDHKNEGFNHIERPITMTEVIHKGVQGSNWSMSEIREQPVAYIDEKGRVIEEDKIWLDPRLLSMMKERPSYKKTVEEIEKDCRISPTPISENFAWHEGTYNDIPSLMKVRVWGKGASRHRVRARIEITTYIKDYTVSSPPNTYRRIHRMKDLRTYCVYSVFRKLINNYSKQQISDLAIREWNNELKNRRLESLISCQE